jgi:Tfp pilus assembly protein PilF
MAELVDSMSSRPDDMASHYNLGNFYMARNQMPDAAEEFQTASRLQPEALPPYVNAALAYNALGQNDKAEASLRHALSLDATNAAANLNLGMLLAEVGKMSEAEQAFRAAFKADPKSAQAAYNLGILLSKGQPREALTWSRRATELRPENPQYGYTYAFFLATAGQYDEALRVLRVVRQRFPAHEDSLLLEQQLLKREQGKRSDAKAQ